MHVNPTMQNQTPPNFQLSNCKLYSVHPIHSTHISIGQGRKRALLIGINYFGSSSELNGCIHDVHNLKEFLIKFYHFKAVRLKERHTSVPNLINNDHRKTWLS